MKKFLSMLLTAVLLVMLFPVSAFADKAEYSSEEVIYGVLDAEGKINKIIPVVVLDAEKETEVEYYGDFKKIKNLTNTDEISADKDEVKLKIPEGRFYFSAETDRAELPWKIDISYKLDGKNIPPENLGGKDGKLQIKIEIKENKKADTSFFDAYLMQISATLSSEKCKNIEAEGATLANAGANKMINFMCMPGTEGEFLIEADVKDFAMGGMSIAAVPLSMADMLGSMGALNEGLDQFTEAMEELSSGVSQLNSGAYQLSDGMNQFSIGLLTLSANSQPLRDAAKMMHDGLKAVEEMLDKIPDSGEFPDLSIIDINTITQPFYTIAANIRATADRITAVQGSISSVIESMNAALLVNMDSVDEGELNEILSLYPNTGYALYNGYLTALNAQTVWADSSAKLYEANTELEAIALEINGHADSIEQTADALKEIFNSQFPGGQAPDMKEFISQAKELVAGFAMFYDGIIQYTQGVDLLADNSIPLADGVTALAGGTAQLDSGTSQIPEKMDEMIDDMAGDDFTAHSFLSEKNKNVSSVQFVFSTEGISAPGEEPAEEPQEQELSGAALFFSKFKELFKKAEG